MQDPCGGWLLGWKVPSVLSSGLCRLRGAALPGPLSAKGGWESLGGGTRVLVPEWGVKLHHLPVELDRT